MAGDNGKSGFSELRECQLTCFDRPVLRHEYSKLRDAIMGLEGPGQMFWCWLYGYPQRNSPVYWTQTGFHLLSDSNISFIPFYKNKRLDVQSQTQIKSQWKYCRFQAEGRPPWPLGVSCMTHSDQRLFIYFFRSLIHSLTQLIFLVRVLHAKCPRQTARFWHCLSQSIRWQTCERIITMWSDHGGECSRSYENTDKGVTDTI